jgi:hypothetical protein
VPDDLSSPDAESDRQKGHRLACEGILRAHFGRRPSAALTCVIEQLRREEAGSAISGPAQISPINLRVSGWLEFLRTAFVGRWAIGLSAVGCVAAMAGVLIWWFGATVGEAVLDEIHGGGLVLERGGQAVPALPGTGLRAGDTLRVPAAVTAGVGYGPEHTRILFGPDTELRVLSFSRGKRFGLEKGKVDASVARQRPFQPMILRTPQAEARVLGTRFTLTVTTNATRLEVSEGKVRLIRSSDGAAVPVPAGNYAVAASTYELRAQPLTGSILREYWTNLPSTIHMTLLLANPQFPDHPNGGDYLDRMEAPSHWGENYGAHICGYLHPPKTGEYTFWIEVGGVGELWLSPDDKPENRQQIGFASEEPVGQSHPSSPISLVAGRKYYLEARYKQGAKEKDYLAVVWSGPDRGREIIPGEFLSPLIPQQKKP